MNGLEEDVRRATQASNEWRAQYLRGAANRLDVHIEKLKVQAAEYRALAAKINPTSDPQ